MGQGVDEAQQQRELSKAALAGDLDRLEARVRHEIDWRARLRRGRGKIIGFGVAVVVVIAAGGAVFILRRRFGGSKGGDTSHPVTLAHLDEELHELRRRVEKKNGGTGSLAQKVVLRGVAAAGSAGGTLLARQMLKRQMATPEGTETARGG